MASFGAHSARSRPYSMASKPPPRSSTALPLHRMKSPATTSVRSSTSAGGYATARESSNRRWIDVTTDQPKLTHRKPLGPKSSVDISHNAGSSDRPVKAWANSSLDTGSYYTNYMKQKGYGAGNPSLVAPWNHGPAPHPRQRDPMPTARSQYPPVGADPEQPSPHVPRKSAERNFGSTRVLDQTPLGPPRTRDNRSVVESDEMRSALDEADAARRREEEKNKRKDDDTPVDAPYRWRRTPEPHHVPKQKAEAVGRTLGTTFKLHYDRTERDDVDALVTSRRSHNARGELIAGRVPAPWSEERVKLEMEQAGDGRAGDTVTPRLHGRRHVIEPRNKSDSMPSNQHTVTPPYLYDKSYRPGINRRYQSTTSDDHHTIPLDGDKEALNHEEEMRSLAMAAMAQREDAPWTKGEEVKSPSGQRDYDGVAPYSWQQDSGRRQFDLHHETRKKHPAKMQSPETFDHVLPGAQDAAYASSQQWLPSARDSTADERAREGTKSHRQAVIEARRARMEERAEVERRLRDDAERREVASLAKFHRSRDLHSDPLSM